MYVKEKVTPLSQINYEHNKLLPGCDRPQGPEIVIGVLVLSWYVQNIVNYICMYYPLYCLKLMYDIQPSGCHEMEIKKEKEIK